MPAKPNKKSPSGSTRPSPKPPSRASNPTVNQQNVSAWKKSGFQRWKENKRARDLADRISAISETADPTTPDSADKLAAALIAELAIIKENYEPGEERTRRILMIVAGVVQLRRTNQAKGWLKIEVAKTKMSLTRFQRETGDQINVLTEDPEKTERGLSTEALEEIDCLIGEKDDDEHTYETMSEQEVRDKKIQMKEASSFL